MPATAADIPPELYDLIVSFFQFNNDGEQWDDRRRRNDVPANKRELGWLALVCRRWARLCQPKIFWRIMLRSRDDVESLLGLLDDPKCRIAECIKFVKLSQSVATYPYLPWIHLVHVKLLPQLALADDPWRPMAITGPLPAGKSLSSIHGVLPRGCPSFTTGIYFLSLNNLHFLSLGHLTRLLKELPSLSTVECERVTWDGSPDALLHVATSCLGRNTYGEEVAYRMRGCTDNVVAGWLLWLLAPSQATRLEQQDSDALCRITSELFKDIDSAQFPNWTVESRRQQDELYFRAWDNGDRSTPKVTVYLTSAVPGQRTRRRVRAILLDFSLVEEVSSAVGWDCWPAIDAEFATLPDLHTVLIQIYSHDEMALFARDVITSKMPHLRDSARLKYAYEKPADDEYETDDNELGSDDADFGTDDAESVYLWYTHDTVNLQDQGQWVENLVAIL